MAELKKNEKRNRVLHIVCLCVGIALIAFSVIQLVRIYGNYHKSNALYDDLEQEYVTKVEEPDTQTEASVEVPWYEMVQVDFDSLLQQNSDVCGWIFFENEDISYPVLHAKDNDTYLRTTLDMQPATAGSIFVEALNNPDFSDYHTIIYGHNMRNLSMFGKLKFYEQKKNYYEEHQYFQIITPTASYRYQIYAYEQVEEDSDMYTVYSQSEGGYKQLLDKIASRSEVTDSPVEVTQDDRIVTLSTCVAGRSNMRFLVHGVLVEEVSNQ